MLAYRDTCAASYLLNGLFDAACSRTATYRMLADGAESGELVAGRGFRRLGFSFLLDSQRALFHARLRLTEAASGFYLRSCRVASGPNHRADGGG